jgi:prepilin-type N-terminal cleavage/methylation domain-containing protein
VRHNQSGFALIEIAVVLVIIGLLLGGVLKGQELITQAKIKNVINDFNGLATAVYAYQHRYEALPGEDPNAGTRWTITLPATTTTYGSGKLETADKLDLFWRELRLAGLIAGDPSSTATANNATGGTVAVQWITGTNVLGFTTPGVAICSDLLPAKVAESVDLQLDDGKSNGGTIRGTANATITNTPASNYLDTTTPTMYIICKAR